MHDGETEVEKERERMAETDTGSLGLIASASMSFIKYVMNKMFKCRERMLPFPEESCLKLEF